MTAREMYDFFNGQVACYQKQIEFENEQINFCNRQLKRTRKEDKELKEYALSARPDDSITVQVFGGNYIGTETRKYINERARRYRAIKHNEKRIAYYRKQAEEMEKYIG